MQRVLVVGGAGVVGSALVDRLVAEGNEVVAIDDLSQGSYANVAHLKRNPRFTFVEHDVTEPFRAEVDRVFHLAIPSTRRSCNADPVHAALTCVLGTRHALEVAAAHGARVVLGTGTERWGEGVRCAERLALDFAKANGLDVRLVRMPAVYGPRLGGDGSALVSTLVGQALRGERLVPGVRLDRRVRLAYVDDIVDTLARTMAMSEPTPSVVAPSSEIEVGALARLVAEMAGQGSLAIDEDTMLDGAPPSVMPSSVRPTLADAVPASTALGQTPQVALEDGLRRTIAWLDTRSPRRAKQSSGVFERRPAAPLTRRVAS